MPTYWVIAPHEADPPAVYESAWKYAREHGRISIGWGELGDVSSLGEAELKDRIRQTFGDKPSMVYSYFRRFYHEISEGDIVVAKRGRMKIAGVGTVTRTGFYDEASGKAAVGNAPGQNQPNFLGVDWDQPGLKHEIILPGAVLAIGTLYELPEAKFLQFMKGDPSPDGTSDPVESSIVNESEFVLEKYLQEFIVSNFNAIFGQQHLSLYADDEGRSGALYPTDAGEIDILARSQDGFVVIELKKGRASDVVTGQVLRYMGWVQENLCLDGSKVGGLIICKDHDVKLDYAIKMVPSVSIKYYGVSFALKDSHA